MARARYRITFYPSAEVRLDPFEFAWLLSKHCVEVIGKEPSKPVLHVRAMYPEQIERFAAEVNRMDGPLIFEKVEAATPDGYVEYEFGGAS